MSAPPRSPPDDASMDPVLSQDDPTHPRSDWGQSSQPDPQPRSLTAAAAAAAASPSVRSFPSFSPAEAMITSSPSPAAAADDFPLSQGSVRTAAPQPRPQQLQSAAAAAAPSSSASVLVEDEVPTKRCSRCEERLPVSLFSSAQLKKQGKRLCAHCVAFKASSAAPPSLSHAAEDMMDYSESPIAVADEFSLSQGSIRTAVPQPRPQQQPHSRQPAQAASAAAASSSSSVPSSAASVMSGATAAPGCGSARVPSLSKVIFDGALECAARVERVVSVIGIVKEVQTIHRRQICRLYRCKDKECDLVMEWPLSSAGEPRCEECDGPTELLKDDQFVVSEDNSVTTQLVMVSTPHYSMSPKAQADAEAAAAAAAAAEEAGASPLAGASSPGGASVSSSSSSAAASASAASVSSSAAAAAAPVGPLASPVGTPSPHVVEVQLMGEQCGKLDVGDEVEVQGRLCIRPLAGTKRCVLFIRAAGIRARSLVDRPVQMTLLSELLNSPHFLSMLVGGFAPSVLGNSVSKFGCLLSVVSPQHAVRKEFELSEARRNLHALVIGRDEHVIPMLQAAAMASPNGLLESLSARNSAPQAASRFVVEPPHCTEAAWAKALSESFAKVSVAQQESKSADAQGAGGAGGAAEVSAQERAVVGVCGAGTVEYADAQIGMHKRGVIAFHVNSGAAGNKSADHWQLPFDKYELNELMRTGVIFHVSGLGVVQRVTHTPTAIIVGGSATKDVPYDDAKSFKDNTGLNGHLFNEFDLHLRVDDKLSQELQASYVEQCTSPAPLTGPRSPAGAGASSASRAAPSPVASVRSQSARSLRMRLQLPAGVDPVPPSVLALFVRACLQKAEPQPLTDAEMEALQDRFMALYGQQQAGAKVGPFGWCSLLRTMRAIARLHMADKVTPRHVEDAFELLTHTRADFQLEPQTVQFQSTGARSGSGRAATLSAMRQSFLTAMYAHCDRTASWVQPAGACWDVAVSCGLNRLIGPQDFVQAFLQPMMDRQMILQGPSGTYKFNRNLNA